MKVKVVLEVVLFVLADQCTAFTETDEVSLEANETSGVLEDSWGHGLTNGIKVTHYDLHLFPDLQNGTFSGEVAITMLGERRTRQIDIHLLDLDIGRLSFECLSSPSDDIDIDAIKFHPYQVASLIVTTDIRPGQTYLLKIQYSGFMVSDNTGVNKITYKDTNGKERVVVGTQLQNIGARKVFPCFDEPSLKAFFTISLTREQHMTAVSNMPLLDSHPVADASHLRRDKFQTTPLMSTYLVAFAIFDFASHIVNYSSSIPITFWTRQDVLPLADSAARLTPLLLDFYEDYFDMNFPLPKLDVVAFPSFPVPAMENFGLIITRESSLLGNSSAQRSQWVATVMAHELAHQWVGNVITPLWWNLFWINEGLATYFAALALEHVGPALSSMNQLVTEFVYRVKRKDSLGVVNPLQKTTFNPIEERFDNFVLYYKGAAVTRMIANAISPEAFRSAIRNLVDQRSFSSLNEFHLFHDLTSSARRAGMLRLISANGSVTMSDVMLTWVKQKGLPLVSMTTDESGTMFISQHPFISRAADSDYVREIVNSTWWIPVSIMEGPNPLTSLSKAIWLPPTGDPLPLPMKYSPKNWILLNHLGYGYYHVNYTEENWNSLSRQLRENHTVFDVLDRVHILEDAFRLAELGYMSPTVPLDMSLYLSKETSFYPWTKLMDAMLTVDLAMRYEKEYPSFKSFLSSLILPVLEQIGNSSTLLDQLLRTELISWLCKLHHFSCMSYLLEDFNSWKSRPLETSDLPASVSNEEALCAIFENSSADSWMNVWDAIIRKKVVVHDKDLLISGLTCTIHKPLLQKMTDAILQCGNISALESILIVENMAKRLVGRDVIWNFLTKYWKELTKRFRNPFALMPLPYTMKDIDLLRQWSETANLGEKRKADVDDYISRNILPITQTLQYVDTVKKWLLQNDFTPS